MNQPLQLYRLQQVDSRIDEINSRLGEINAILSDDRVLIAAEAKVKQAETTLDDTKKTLRKAEENTRAQRTKIEQTNSQLFGGKVRNPKVLQDLQNESAALKRYLAVLEERQLEIMLLVDEHSEALFDFQKDLSSKTAKRVETHASLNGEKTQLLKEIEKMTEERNAAVTGMDDETISLYEKLRKRYRGIAIAKVTDNSCGACGNTLNSASLQAVKSPNNIVKCDNCSRILFSG